MKSYFATGKTKIESFETRVVGSSCEMMSPYIPVTTGFTRILLFFKLIGRFPHKAEQIWDEGTLYTRFDSGISKSTAWSYLIGTFTVTFLMLGMVQSGSCGLQLFAPGDIWPDRVGIVKEKSKEFGAYASTISRSFECIYSLLGVINYLSVFIKRNKEFTEWLNNWNKIEREILSLENYSAGAGNIINYKFANAIALIYIGLWSIMFSTLLVYQEMDSSRMFWNFIYCFLCFGINFVISSEDVQTILMFKTARDAYKQVRFNMETCGGDSGIIVSKNIAAWNRILIGIRNQVKLGGECVAFQQLLSIGTLVYFLSASLFLCFVSFNRETTKSSNVILLILTFTAKNFVRIYCKVFYAAGVPYEEQKVVSVAKGIEVDTVFSSDGDKLKVMRLHDMLVGSPVEVSLKGYATMNNSLLISIFGQVVAQCIIFMQFQQSGGTTGPGLQVTGPSGLTTNY